MKKTLKLMGLCALAVLALAGCKKNEQNGNMTFKATISQLNSDAKTEIGAGNWLVWNTGDQIKVYTADKTEANAANFTLATGAGTTDATFSGTLAESDTCYAFYPTTGIELTSEGKFKLPVSDTQTFVDANFTTNTFPMCATATDGDLEFHSPYGILGIPMKGTATIGSIVLTDSLGMNLVGYYEMNDVDTTFIGSGAAITLNFGEGLTLSADTAKTAYFIVPAGVFTIGFKAEVKGTDGNRITMLETSKNNIIVKEYIRLMPEVTGVDAPAPAPAVPEGALPGVFTVDNAGKKVYFSQANLMFSNGTWSFHENQYDCCFSSNGNVDGSYTSTGTFDYFAWGTSGYNHGALCYQPWSKVNNYQYYYVYGNNSYNLFDMTGKADWGYNAISNGGNTENYGWRTLTREEWKYVFTERTGPTINSVDNVRFIHATVNGRNGIILFPDFYTHPSELADHQPVGSGANTTYSAMEFALMHADGAVFLPKVGSIHAEQTGNSVISGFNTNGHYWSSSRSGGSTAYDWTFNGWSEYSMDMQREYRCCVRLVYDVQ